MYGREELKKIYISEIDYLYSVRYNHESHYYDAKEADSVMDAYEQRIKELEAKLKETDEVMDSCKGLIESASVMSKSAEDNLFNRIKKLEAENKALRQANLDCYAHFASLKEDYGNLKTELEEMTQTKNAYKTKYIALQNENKELKKELKQ